MTHAFATFQGVWRRRSRVICTRTWRTWRYCGRWWKRSRRALPQGRKLARAERFVKKRLQEIGKPGISYPRMVQTAIRSGSESAIGMDQFIDAFRLMLLARTLDEKFASLYRANKIHG